MNEQDVWELPSGRWIQDDVSSTFTLLDPETGKKAPNQKGLEVIAGAKWHGEGQTRCSGFFPAEFGFCPFCGDQLITGDTGDTWVPPYGRGNGLRLVSSPIEDSGIEVQGSSTHLWLDQEPTPFQLPRLRGNYEFIVGSPGISASILIAFDRTTGKLDYFSPTQEKWFELQQDGGPRVSESKLPFWSWSVALAPDHPGFAFPTSEGPVWIALDWARSKFTPTCGSGKVIGGIASLGPQVYALVMDGDFVGVHGFDFAASKWEQKGNALSKFEMTTYEPMHFSVPVVDEGRQLIQWIGITGLLTFDPVRDDFQWRPWNTASQSCQAVPELGPPYQDPQGNFWQICYDKDDDVFKYFKLSGDQADCKNVDGGRFSSGLTCFSKFYDHWEPPWVKVDANRFEKARSARAPLVCLSEEAKATVVVGFADGSTQPLLQIIRDRSKLHLVTLWIERKDELGIELRLRDALEVSAPWELRVFLYDGTLFVYSAERSVCNRWRLK
jgi:hypothetical protein